MIERVVVFLDYQNVYGTARTAFHGAAAPPSAGQIDPVRLAEYMTANGRTNRRLLEIRVYRGEPSARHAPCRQRRVVPALEVVTTRSPARVEVAAWAAGKRSNPWLKVPARRLFCHWMPIEAYRMLRDPTNYARPTGGART